MISRIANIHLCPTQRSIDNLKKENLDNYYLVGNTSLDNLISLRDKCSYDNKILITLHRRENHSLIQEWFSQIEKLAVEYSTFEFILPIHPNPNVVKYRNLLNKVKILEPLDHNEFLQILSQTTLCITDSGGLQEEASFLNKKCIVCRLSTERSEGIDSGHIVLCKNPKELPKIFKNVIQNYRIDSESPFGIGDSSYQIQKLLETISVN